MPGRKDFGILLSSALTDPRVRTAARFYVAKKLALKASAMYAVLGHLSTLGLHLARETDDGVIRGPIADALTVFLPGTSPADAERIAEVLSDPSVGLLRPVVGGHYLAGFHDAYAPVVAARASARQRAAIARAAALKARSDQAKAAGIPVETVPGKPPETAPQTTSSDPVTQGSNTGATGEQHGSNEGASPFAPIEHSVENEPAEPNSSRDRRVTLQVSVPFRSVEESPPPPVGGGRGSLRSPHGDDPDDGAEEPDPTDTEPEPEPEPEPSPNPKPLRPRARELLARKLDYLAATGTIAERNRAVQLRKLNRDSPLPDSEVRNLLDSLRWITSERLSRHQADAGWSRSKPARDGEIV